MIGKDSYYYLDFKGNSKIPKLNDIIQDSMSETVNLLIPDNNVCQHLAQYYKDKSKLNDIVIRKIERFLIEVDHSAIDVCAAFGVLELSSNRETLTIDKNKHESFGQSVLASLNLPRFNLATGFSSFFTNDPAEDESIFPLMPMLNLFYTHLLKIKLIETNGLSRNLAMKNIKEYLYWAEKMGAQTIYPTQVAYALFGGEPKARKIIKIERDKNPLQSVWGAAWDMMYLFIAQQFTPLVNIGGMKHKLIFVTNDEACWLIGSLFKLHGAIKNNRNVEVSFGEVSIDFPHYRDKIVEIKQISLKIKMAQAKRASNKDNKGKLISNLNNEKSNLESKLLDIYGVSHA